MLGQNKEYSQNSSHNNNKKKQFRLSVIPSCDGMLRHTREGGCEDTRSVGLDSYSIS